MALTLARLGGGIARRRGPAAVTATSPSTEVTADSRQAGPGVLFVAVPRHRRRRPRLRGRRPGRRLPRRGGRWTGRAPTESLPAAPAPPGRPTDTRALPALLARAPARRPDRDLVAVGVTGTNGKTTVAFLLRALLGQLAGPCGLLGTIRYDDGRRSDPRAADHPGRPRLLRTGWARMVDARLRPVAMELSSHALDQERTAGLALDVAVLTNLGRDHLDYHADLAAYLAAKARILDLLGRTRRASDRGRGAQRRRSGPGRPGHAAAGASCAFTHRTAAVPAPTCTVTRGRPGARRHPTALRLARRDRWTWPARWWGVSTWRT